MTAAKTISAGGDLKDSKVTLFLYSQNLDVAKLSALLGCTPTHAQEKGQLRRTPHGQGPAPIGLWSLEAPRTVTFEKKIQWLLDSKPASGAIWRRLANSHDVQLRCGIFMHAWNEGFELPAETVVNLGKRRWKLGVDIYSAEGDEIIDAFLRHHNA